MDDNSVSGGAGMSSNTQQPVSPLGTPEDVLNAAKQAADASTTTPQDQFVAQFGPASQPPVQATEEIPVTSVPPAMPNVAQQSSVAEDVSSQPTQTPAEKLKEEISISINKFLEEIAK